MAKGWITSPIPRERSFFVNWGADLTPLGRYVLLARHSHDEACASHAIGEPLGCPLCGGDFGPLDPGNSIWVCLECPYYCDDVSEEASAEFLDLMEVPSWSEVEAWCAAQGIDHGMDSLTSA